MDIIAAYHAVGSYRGAAEMCGTCHKTVRRVLERHEAGEQPPVVKGERAHNYDGVRDLVAQRVRSTSGRITAKRLLPEAVTAGYEGSARNFRRLVRKAKHASTAVEPDRQFELSQRMAITSPGWLRRS